MERARCEDTGELSSTAQASSPKEQGQFSYSHDPGSTSPTATLPGPALLFYP
ncbi:hypothetical protein STEG23_004149, partial [Scotinomys teguina]